MEVKKVHTGNRDAIRHHTGVPLPAGSGRNGRSEVQEVLAEAPAAAVSWRWVLM